MKKEYICEHGEFGRLHVKVNPRARRFTFRVCDDGLSVTAPVGATQKELLTCIDKMTPELKKLVARHNVKHKNNSISPGFRIDTPDFCMSMRHDAVERPKAYFSNGNLEFVLPENLSLETVGLRAWIEKIAEEALRIQGKLILPQRMAALADRFGFTFKDVKIHKTHGRWGSCSSKGNINLSLYLLLLPRHLQDYVMLHELCHTVEMNHGPRFWKKMDEVTDNSSLALREEMKKYDTSIFTLNNLG